MLDLFSDIKSTILRRRSVYIDNAVFRLHWLVTSTLLATFSLVLTARQYVGQPIDCFLDSRIIQSSLINTYCWISPTFIIPSTLTQKIGIDVPHPGVDNSHRLAFHKASTGELTKDFSGNVRWPDRKYYPYYQWVCFVLFLQAICFYLPHYIWKMTEGGLMQSLSMNLQIAIMGDEERTNRKKHLADYLFQHFKMYSSYAYKYLFCEFLCFFSLIVQIVTTDLFLDGQFIPYGFQVLRQSNFFQKHLSNYFLFLMSDEKGTQTNPFEYIFPHMTKCIFHLFGSSGDVQRKDALCLLPLNVFHEKIYLFLWFWFFILFLLTALLLLVRLVMLFAVKYRARILKTRCKFCSYKHLSIICRRGNFGDFFVFYLLSKNVDPVVMQELVYDVGKRLARQDNYYAYNSTSRHNSGLLEPAHRSSSRKFHPV